MANPTDSTPTSTPTPNPTPTPTPPAPTPTPPAPDDGLGDAGRKAIAAERKAARDAQAHATQLETRLKEYEDRDKSDSEKAIARAETAERRVAELELSSARLEAAAEHGLTPEQATRLIGTTRDELMADAPKLKALVAPTVGTNEPSHPDFDLGQRPAPLVTDTSPQGLIAAGLARTTTTPR